MNKVYLVGAGPGDPELLTLKAKRLLEAADVILYDNLANAELLLFSAPGAIRTYVGKKKANHSMSQQEICELLIDLGRRHRIVVRLKGGDPFMFGRGGEEAEALADAGIAFEVVPGVTSPLGIAAYTGVPLTHRDHTSVVTFITGHEVAKIDWHKVGAAETLVIFMGLSHFDEIAQKVIDGGRPANTPAMAVRWGTRPDQEVVTGTLETLPQILHERQLKPPATIVIGDVVTLRTKLNWFEKLPLFGQTVVVTRPREQASALRDPLQQLGARVIGLPAIEILPPRDGQALDDAIANLSSFDWLLFTSVNGVNAFFKCLEGSASDTRAIRGRICAIGPATRDALRAAGIKTDVMAEEYVAEGVLRALASFDLEGKKILIARAAVARDTLPRELAARGAIVVVAEAYFTGMPPTLVDDVNRVTKSLPDWITFTSSSTVENMVTAAGADILRSIRAASIGPVTSAALRRHGIEPAAEASVYTVPGLIEAILAAGIIGS